MIGLVVEPESVDQAVEHIDAVRQRILASLRDGMQRAMAGLAGAAVEEMAEAGIQNRSGELKGAIVRSPWVSETPLILRGNVTADVGMKHVGLWMEEGTNVPAVEGKIFEFAEPDAESLYSHGHAAFQVRARPFMNPALQKYQDSILQILADAVAEAIAE
ncbi:MAG TPA: hypothetical protein VM554_12880 [Acidisarcina sp.]|nr:hypothetical protein [Acidisarcina sp.]